MINSMDPRRCLLMQTVYFRLITSACSARCFFGVRPALRSPRARCRIGLGRTPTPHSKCPARPHVVPLHRCSGRDRKRARGADERAGTRFDQRRDPPVGSTASGNAGGVLCDEHAAGTLLGEAQKHCGEPRRVRWSQPISVVCPGLRGKSTSSAATTGYRASPCPSAFSLGRSRVQCRTAVVE